MIKVYVVQIEENIDYVTVCETVESVVKEIMNVYNKYGVLGITREKIINQIKEREKENNVFCFVTDEDNYETCGLTVHKVSVI